MTGRVGGRGKSGREGVSCPRLTDRSRARTSRRAGGEGVAKKVAKIASSECESRTRDQYGP